MANFNIEQALSEVKDSSTKQLIEFLLSENNKKSQEIITLKNELCALEQRITLQERYSSKGCLVFENVPWDGKEFLPTFITRLLSEYMNFLTNPENFKACHVFGRGQKNTPPAIIVKFAYFHEKNEIYSKKKDVDVNSPKTIDDNMAIAVQKKKSRLPMGTQKVVGTKQYHTVQLATENKAVSCRKRDFRSRNGKWQSGIQKTESSTIASEL